MIARFSYAHGGYKTQNICIIYEVNNLYRQPDNPFCLISVNTCAFPRLVLYFEYSLSVLWHVAIMNASALSHVVTWILGIF